MKTVKFIKGKLEKLTLLVVMLFTSIKAIAQQAIDTAKTITTTTTSKTEEWYTNPVYLVVGAILLIILIAIIARGGSKKD